MPEEVELGATNNRGRILLVSMPWAPATMPSIQLAVLKAALRGVGIACDTLHAYLPLAGRIGLPVYGALTSCGLPSEGFFSRALHGGSREADDVAQVASKEAQLLSGRPVDPKAIAEAVQEYMDGLWSKVRWSDYRVVGFSVTFSQLAASLALAQRLKREHPAVKVLFGGWQCSGSAHVLIRECDYIDAIVEGEGERTIVQLLSDATAPLRPDVPGVVYQGSKTDSIAPCEANSDLDTLPFPDYGEFFTEIEEAEIPVPLVTIAIEGSRGCWWNQCSFCSLNGSRQAYRAKSPGRVISEILQGIRQYNCLNFAFADTIAQNQAFPELMRLVRDLRRQYDVSFIGEFRATLSKCEIAALADAGFERIQIGVESLSTGILKKMRKGTLAAQNVQALKWCQEYGIELNYNIIGSFPSETAEELREMAAAIPALHHLTPPTIGHFSLQRGSPVFRRPDKFGIHSVAPADEYVAVYRSPAAPAPFYHTYAEPDGHSLQEPRTALTEALKCWRRGHFLERSGNDAVLKLDGVPGPELTVRDGGAFLEFSDTRSGKVVVRRIKGIARQVYLLCDAYKSRRQILQECADAPSQLVDSAIAMLLCHKLLFQDGDRLVGLATHARRQVRLYKRPA